MLIQWDGKKVIADYIRNQLEEDYAPGTVQITSLLVVMIRDYNKRLYIPLVSYRHSF